MVLDAPVVAESPADLLKSFYSPGEVADLAGVSSSTILNYVGSGKLVAVRLSERTIRIPRKAVIRLLGWEWPMPSPIERPSAVVDL